MVQAARTLSENSCLHCGQPNPPGRVDFCCGGCRAVYSTIKSLGLDRFYELRDSALIPKDLLPTSAGGYSYLDQPELIRDAVRAQAPDELCVALNIDGVQCTGCVWLLERLPKIKSGVLKSQLNFGDALLTLTFNPNAVKLSEIAGTIDSLGYRPSIGRERALALDQKQDRVFLWRIGVAGFCTLNTMMLAVSLYQGLFTGIEAQYATLFRWVSLILALPVVTYSAYPFYRRALSSLSTRSLHIDLPLALAIIAGFTLSAWNTLRGNSRVYFDSISGLVFLLLIGRWLQYRALKSARNIYDNSIGLLPLLARRASGEEILARAVIPGDEMQVGVGEVIPVDGLVVSGSSRIDQSTLTGEAEPVQVSPGSALVAGTTNIESPLFFRASSSSEESRFAKLIRTIRMLGEQKPKLIELTDRISKYFVAGVLCLATIEFCITFPRDIYVAIELAMALLIVTCPCALGIATPVALGVAIGRAAKSGILIRTSQVFENLLSANTVYFDKTGTLTTGQLKVCEFLEVSKNFPEGRLLQLISTLSKATPAHPVSKALTQFTISEYFEKTGAVISDLAVEELRAQIGRGVSARVPGYGTVALGSKRYMSENEINIDFELPVSFGTGSMVHLGIAGKLAAVILLRDEPRVGIRSMLSKLSNQGKALAILSGDRQENVLRVAKEVGISLAASHGELSPEEKAEYVRADSNYSIMVGDGVNDALSLRLATVGIAVSGGVETCLESSDVLIRNYTPERLQALFDGARRVRAVIFTNIALSTAYNVFGAWAAFMGYVNPIFAAILMPISSLTVISISIIGVRFRVNNSGR